MARSSPKEIEPRDVAHGAEGGGPPLSCVATLAAALERAPARKAAGEESVRAEVARLEALRRSADALRRQVR